MTRRKSRRNCVGGLGLVDGGEWMPGGDSGGGNGIDTMTVADD